VSKYFALDEFACHCGCGFNSINPLLLALMDDIREKAGVPIIVTSGCRCEYWNRHEGGEENSQHLYGNACDFTCEEISMEQLAQWAEELQADGVGRYSTWIHADCREGRTGGKYRW